jgi:ribose transport system substrate-binding protein
MPRPRPRTRTHLRLALLLAVVGPLLLGAAACGERSTARRLAFVTNNPSDFWTLVRRGVEQADSELPGFEVDFRIPPNGTPAEQQEILDALLARGTLGIAISPVDPANQAPSLDVVASRALVVTADSDAPQSRRLCYVGTDNVAAGRLAGAAIREAAGSGGGGIALFVGSRDARNAVDRMRGIAEALDGSGLEILQVRTDETDRVRAKANVLDLLTAHPNVRCLVGIWSYNGPAILNAVRERGLAGKVPIVCFDEEDDTLQGVADGHVHATIVQQPFAIGRMAILTLAKAIDGDRSTIPSDGLLHIDARTIRKADVAAFRTELQSIRGR